MMAFNPFLFVLGIMALVFSVPLVAIWTEHRRKLLELKLRLNAERDARAPSGDEVRDLARQLSELRATATEYDISFDSALQRLESRMNLLDERLKRLEHSSGTTAEQDAAEVRLGAR
jgi:hypothetical protein